VNELQEVSLSSGDSNQDGDVSTETGRGAETLAAGSGSGSDTRRIQSPAEPLTRGEHRERIRQGPSAGADGSTEDTDTGNGARTEANGHIGSSELAEPLTRDEYRERIRQGPSATVESHADHADSAANPGADAGHQDKSYEPSRSEHKTMGDAGKPASVGDAPDQPNPDGHTGPAHHDGQVAHFHSEFKGHSLDLYTDGSRWATVDRPRAEDMVSGKPDVPDNMPTGEELVEDAGEDASRLEKFRTELYRESDDALDSADKGADFVHDVFSHPPSGSYESTPVNHPYIAEASHSGVDPGSMVTALFTLGLVIDRGVRWVNRHHGDRAKRS
jgi:hypothetical protein